MPFDANQIDTTPGSAAAAAPSHATRARAGEAAPSDYELAQRVRAGDGEALGALYDRYAPTVIGLARSILRDGRLAEEAAHDVFVSFWQNPAGYDASRGPFSGWLFRVARNRAIDLLRRQREQPFASTAADDEGDALDPTSFLVDTEPDPADQAVTLLERAAVRKSLGTLNEDHRRLLELAYFRGMTQSEIARYLNRPLGTVKTQIRSAMQRLGAALAEQRAPEAEARPAEVNGLDPHAPRNGFRVDDKTAQSSSEPPGSRVSISRDAGAFDSPLPRISDDPGREQESK
jgi:RNA polymerase sigma-70 factor (ECF subfamily)